MIRANNCTVLQGRDGIVNIRRNGDGVPDISAASYRDCSFGLGFVHARDMQLRMILARTILRGRSAEVFNSSEDLIRADYYIRSLNLYPDIERQKQLLEREVRESSESYAEGVNYHFDKTGPSPELKLLKSAPEPWEVEDTMYIAKLIFSFQAMESQKRLKKLIIRMVKSGIDGDRLKELFPVIEGTVDTGLLKKVTVYEDTDTGQALWLSNIPSFISGNAWAVSGRHAAGGRPILCSDIHLEVNRTPQVWHEVILRLPDDVISGFTIPGIPCVVAGRNRNLAFSGINFFTDITDFRIEECRSGKYRRGGTWHHFDVRREYISTGDGGSIKAEFYENEYGVLEGDPFIDGYYLVGGWPAWKNCGAGDLNMLYNVMRSNTVREAMKHYRALDSISLNFVMADTAGNIGSQMSGRMLNRHPGDNGLIPIPAWDRKFDSRGFVAKNRLSSVYNPVNGMVIAADNYHEIPEETMPGVSSYRHGRIRHMLRRRKKSDTEYMKELQRDLCSLQAEKFMKVIFPFVNFRRKGRILKEWDMEYSPESKGAFIFDNIYSSIIDGVFGSHDYGRELLKKIFTEPYIFSGYFMNLDNIFFNSKSCWFMPYSRDEILMSAIDHGLRKNFYRYGKKQKIYFIPLFPRSSFFSGLKYFLSGVELPGGTATVNYCRTFEFHGRITAVGASCRLIADMSENSLLTNTPGQLSGRACTGFNKKYFRDWINGIYKKLS